MTRICQDIKDFLSPSRTFTPVPPLLPTCPNPTADTVMYTGIHSITADTLALILRRKINPSGGVEIYDCRNAYEHDGGHIATAINCPTVDALMYWVFELPDRTFPVDACIVLHCEHSCVRGPARARQVRCRAVEDGTRIPQLYILQGGYAAFHRTHPSLCEGGYTRCREDDDHHVGEGKARPEPLTRLSLDLDPGKRRSLDMSVDRPPSRRSVGAATPRRLFDIDGDAF